MGCRLVEARRHQCQRIPFCHLEYQEIQLSCQTHFAVAVAVAVVVAEPVAEVAMQKGTNPEDDCFWLRRTRYSSLCFGPFAGSSGAVGIVHSPSPVLPKPPSHVASSSAAVSSAETAKIKTQESPINNQQRLKSLEGLIKALCTRDYLSGLHLQLLVRE